MYVLYIIGTDSQPNYKLDGTINSIYAVKLKRWNLVEDLELNEKHSFSNLIGSSMVNTVFNVTGWKGQSNIDNTKRLISERNIKSVLAKRYNK